MSVLISHERGAWLGRLILLCVAIATIAPLRTGASGAQPVKLDADRFLQNYDLVTLDPQSVRRDVASSGRLSLHAGLETYEIDLAVHDLRGPSYRAVETLDDGTLRDLPTAPVTTYAGTVADRDGATARFTIDDAHVSGMILDGTDRVLVEPLSTFSLAGGPTDYVVYHAYDVRPEAEPGTCGVTAAEKIDSAFDDVVSDGGNPSKTDLTVVDVATEADNEYVSALGSAQAANADILGILNQVDGVYQAELGLALQVVFQHTFASGDPYTASDPTAMLGEFRLYWGSSFGNVQRDVTHMWTGRDMAGTTIGIAYVGAVCVVGDHAYGISQRWASAPERYVLTAHEIGHNFNACHSDTSCNPNPGSCADTIMNSSVTTNLTFCQFSRGQISSFVSAHHACLSSSGNTPPPAAPSSLVGHASSSKVILGWRDNSSNESGFKVERKTGSNGAYAQIATATAGSTTLTDTSVKAGTTYTYRARATNVGGDSGYSNEATVTTPAATIPAPPSGLGATTASTRQINLSWTDGSDDETGFAIERSAGGKSFEEIGRVGAESTTFASAGLKQGKRYTYRVRAFNDAGASTYSNTASARTKRRK